MKRMLVFFVWVLFGATAAADAHSDKSAKLFDAAMKRDISGVRSALDDGADLNSQHTSKNISALWVASEAGHPKVVRLLLSRGAQVDAEKSGSGATALWMAANRGYAVSAGLLLEKGANANAKGGRYGSTALLAAVCQGKSRLVKLLIDHGADVNASSTIIMRFGRR